MGETIVGTAFKAGPAKIGCVFASSETIRKIDSIRRTLLMT